jgi:pimeloyl-ACP methyl ester carboxylesterase
MNAKQNEKWFFLRGLVREAGHWSGFLEQFEKAFPGREVIPLDIPGNGKRFLEASPLSVSGMAKAVREEFLAKKSAERNHLFALSLGAMISLEWMRRWPMDLQSAVLLNTSVRGLSPFHHRLRPHNYWRILKMTLLGGLERKERTILEMTSHSRHRFEELTQSWLEIQKKRPVSTNNALRQLIAASRFHPPKERPSVPILILNGAGDQLVHPSCSQALGKHWNLPVHVHPSAGHDLTLDAPDWVIEQVRNFS